VQRPVVATRKQPKKRQWEGDGEEEEDEEEDGEHQEFAGGAGPQHAQQQQQPGKVRGSAVFGTTARGGAGHARARAGGAAAGGSAKPPKTKSALTYMEAMETGDAAIKKAAESDAAGKVWGWYGRVLSCPWADAHPLLALRNCKGFQAGDPASCMCLSMQHTCVLWVSSDAANRC
jgi:hypothetical protein